MRQRRTLFGLLAATALALGTTGVTAAAESTATDNDAAAERRLTDVIPAPAEATPDAAADFELTEDTKINAQAGSAEAKQVGNYLAGVLRPATGYDLPVTGAGASGQEPTIALLLDGADDSVGDQGYQLDVATTGVTIRANTGDGLFAGAQSLRQLLPAAIEADEPQEQSWVVPGGEIVDHPRFGYRGAMLDIARHFHTLDEIKSYLDELSQYKINYLHLHLSDDQGWRIQIDSWPDLAPVGGGEGTGVDGVGGGYLTKADYAELNAYAAERHVTIIPEIDMPGHTNAAQSTYAELNCDGVAVPPRTDIEVGYSSLCIDDEKTYAFVEDVIRELAEMTPGPYLHIGGDEAQATTDEDYRKFMNRVVPLVEKYGKRAFGWHEIAKADLPQSAVPQYWGTETSNAEVADAVARGNKVVMSPANKAYIDQKYNENTELGLSWAGYIEVKDAYGWDPGSHVTGVGEDAVLGIEAPMWSETLRKLDDIEFMAFPRLPALAELGWSPKASHDWGSFSQRLASQAPRWEQAGVNFYRSPQVPWPDES